MDEADVSYCFLSPEPMRLIGEQFRSSAKKGCLLVSNSFEIMDMKPVQVIPVKGLLQHDLYVYTC